MSARPRKRSLTLHGHRTSVSLEEPFWQAFREIARIRGLTINALATEIDDARGLESGLASAIRVHVLEHFRAAAAAAGGAAAGGPPPPDAQRC
jgi:predicted DNA-binding ribbon-helix-helix protein